MKIDNSPKNKSILIIDDEKVIIESRHPELVLLDYMMPGIDGLTALKIIRERYPESYVIMFTGKGSEEIAVELMKAGAYDYILKPFNNQDLADRIESVLRIREVEISNAALMKERERLLEEIEGWNRQLEVRVQEKTEALQKMQAENVQAEKLASLGYLSAGVAHEIRNPLNSITLFVQLIKSGIDDPELCEYVDKILKEVDRIDIIIRKLLDASKRPRFELKEVRIDEL